MSTSRSASAVWEGDLKGGKGSLRAESSGAFRDLGITWKARSEAADGKTSSEELLAAAHAGCFSMALAAALAGEGHPPKKLEVRATVSFDPIALRVQSSRLEVRAEVPGIDPQTFEKVAQGAKEGCPISKALAGNLQIDLTTTLQS